MVAISGSGWRLAPCLVSLVKECDKRAPNRSTSSDGSIGDTAHAARESDHNPSSGYVCAVDITDDKAGGCDADLLARLIVARRDPRVKYVIWNRTIVKSYASNGHPAWTPYPYTGINAHESHTHISVHNTTQARNDLSPWWTQPADAEADDMTPEQANQLKAVVALATATNTEVAAIKEQVDRLFDAFFAKASGAPSGNLAKRIDVTYESVKKLTDQ